jgi:hypothetical protein
VVLLIDFGIRQIISDNTYLQIILMNHHKKIMLALASSLALRRLVIITNLSPFLQLRCPLDSETNSC